MNEQAIFSPLPPWPRTDYCGALRPPDRGREVVVQLVFSPEQAPKAHEVARAARAEFYLAIKGVVVERSAATVNAQLATGAIEVAISQAAVLNPSQPPPFPLTEGEVGNEEVRLRYRYLDLRRPEMQRNLRRRHQAVRAVRDHLDEQGFVEIETPILWRATPEGARDYLVPSRVNPGKFYALPQSPQLLKQLLMVSGFDRYYQIARCFRDEDLRANRQPEFSQIDIEMTGARPDDIIEIAEGMIASIYEFALGRSIVRPFPRMSYSEAMERFGSDKPDLRFGLEVKNLTAAFSGTSLRVFADALGRGESIYGLVLPPAYQLSRRELDELTEAIRSQKGLGLAWVKSSDGSWQGPIARHVGEPERARVTEVAALSRGDTLLMIAGQQDKVRPLMGELRLQLAAKFDLRRGNEPRFLWVIDFPMFEYSEEEQRLVAVHHPFTAPNPDDLELLDKKPLEVRALAYDLALNGQEMGGGSIRI